MRNLSEIIDKMLVHIPTEQTRLINALVKEKQDQRYRAPENTIGWHRVHQYLVEMLSDPRKDWEYEVLSVFSTMSVQSIKEQQNNSK